MLTFSSQTLSLGNWITRKQEEATPPPKMFLSKGSVFLLRADPASEGPTVQKLQTPPPQHTHFKNGRKQRKGGGFNNNNNDNKNIWILIEINEENGASSHLPILRALLLHSNDKSKCGISFQELILNQLYAERR